MEINKSQLGWDEYFIGMCYHVQKKSKDPSTKVGCVIVGPDNGIRGTGFNGFPMGVEDLPERYSNRELKYKFVSHSELNAICLAAKWGIELNGCKIYVPWLPCSGCAKAIIQSGIKEVILDKNYKIDPELAKRWADEHEAASIMFQEAGVVVRNSF